MLIKQWLNITKQQGELEKEEVKTARQDSKNTYKRNKTAEIKLFVSLGYGRSRKIGHVFFQEWNEDRRMWINRSVKDVTNTIFQMVARDALRNGIDIDLELMDDYLRSANGSRVIRNYMSFAVPALLYQYNNYPDDHFR